MDRPTWDEREAWALEEAGRSLDRGLAVLPTLVLFEGGEATVYVRGGPRTGGGDQRMAWNEVFALGWALRPEGVLLVTGVRLRTDADDELIGEAEGEAAVGIQWARRTDDGPPEHGGVVHTYGLDDTGVVAWRDREVLPADAVPLASAMTATVTGRWPAVDPDAPGRPADLGMSPASLTYSLSRFGLTIGVASGWVERYGLHLPLDPTQVRREDRRRARERWARRRELTEVRR